MDAARQALQHILIISRARFEIFVYLRDFFD